MKVQNINPTTNEVFAEIESSTEQEIIQKVTEARLSQPSWQELGVKSRIEILKEVYEAFESEKEALGDLITKSVGMPISLRNELDIDSGLHYFKGYLDNAEKYLSPEISFEDDTTINTVYYEPTGVAAAITPWNFPFCNFIWAVIPNLVVGNTVVFKHAEECASFGQLLEQIIFKTNLPKGVFTEIYGDGAIGDILVHQDIDLICFTGSSKVGKYLYTVAAEKFIKIILELGGSAPGIVFEDADISKINEGVFFNRFINSGQICDGLKRLIVHKNIKEKVVNNLAEMLKSKKVGNPEDPAVEIGPLVSIKQLNTLKSQVDDAITKDAEVVISIDSPKTGAFYNPTILTNITKDMKVWTEEVFGPVLPIITFETEEEAINLANDTVYGLGGYVFTEDKQKAERVASKIKTGMVSINNTLYLQPTSPFGGYKQSGLGREHGKYGLHDLCQIKVVSIEK